MENNDENKQLYDMLWKQTSRFFVSALEQLSSSLWKTLSTGLGEVNETIRDAEGEFKRILDILQLMERRCKDIGLTMNEQRNLIQQILIPVDVGNKTMRGQYERLDQLDEKVGIIQKNSKSVDVRIQNIADISETLIVLSINGSIQAARSGEAGQGFAVVTDEMRKISLNIKDFSERQQESISTITRLMSEILEVNKIGKESLKRGEENLGTVNKNIDVLREKLSEAEVLAKDLSGEISNLYSIVEICTQSLSTVVNKMETISGAVKRRMMFNQSLTRIMKRFISIPSRSSSLRETAVRQIECIENTFNSTENGLPRVIMAMGIVILPYSDLSNSFKQEAASRTTKQYKENDQFLCLMGVSRTRSEWKDFDLFREAMCVPLRDNEINTGKATMLRNILSIAGEGTDRVNSFQNENFLQDTLCSLTSSDNDDQYVPNSNFVEAKKIQSQLGVGGKLPSEVLFAIILLFDQKITKEDANSLSVIGPTIQLTWSEFILHKNLWEE